MEGGFISINTLCVQAAKTSLSEHAVPSEPQLFAYVISVKIP